MGRVPSLIPGEVFFVLIKRVYMLDHIDFEFLFC